jgi:hypothetical protein
MASVAECEKALGRLADRLAESAAKGSTAVSFDRSLSCRLTDLDVAFLARLADGLLVDVQQIAPDAAGSAQIKLAMRSDDLPALVDGELNVPKAWATGRIKVSAGVRDLIRLKSLF